MNDIEKMKAEFERKLKIAKLENELNRDLEPKGVRASIFMVKDGRYYVKFYGGESDTDILTPKKLGIIMQAFPMTEQSDISSARGVLQTVDYVMTAHRHEFVDYSELKMRWNSGWYEVNVVLRIDEFMDDGDFAQFFTQTYRESEKPLKVDEERMKVVKSPKIVYYTFLLGNVIKFQGGYDYQSENWVGRDFCAMCIAKSRQEE
jgi:hypothetical protein